MSKFSNTNPIPSDEEIDLFEVARQLWAGRKTILLTSVVFVVFGGLYILYKQLTIIPEYEARVTLFVDSPSPETLPSLIASDHFLEAVLNIRLIHPGTSQIDPVMKVLEQQTRPSQGDVVGLRNRIMTKPGKLGTLEVCVIMQDPLLATQLADSIIQKLAQFLITFQSQRTMKNLQYLTARNFEAKASYLKSLVALSDFYAQNARNRIAKDSITEKSLRAESDLKFDIYSLLAQQIEKIKIKDQDQIPIYTIVEHATVAKQNNSTNTKNIILIMLLLGLFAGAGLLLGKRFYVRIRMTTR